MARINFNTLLFSASLCVALPLLFIGEPAQNDAVPFQKNAIGTGDPLVKIPSGSPTRTFEVGAFSKVDVHSVLHIVVRSANTSSVVAYGPKEVVDAVVVKEKNGRLTIDLDLEGKLHLKEPVVLVIESPIVDEVNLSGAAIAVVENLEAKGFVFGASGAAQAQLALHCKDLRLDLSGGSQLEMTGSAIAMSMDVSGASNLQADGFVTENATIGVSGASQVHVHCTEKLTIDASGASAVEYSGDPKEVIENGSGMAVINKRGPGK